MKVCGVIAEFNPLHKGHEYLLQKARELTGADHVIVVMSGDFVQRGEPAIIGKYCRTEMALRAGADLVLELPAAFATGSAQYFARGAVAALSHTGVVDSLCFGSECGDITELERISVSAQDATCNNGLPANDSDPHSGRFTKTADRLNPNDLLAVEYLRALSDRNADFIRPYTIQRKGAGHLSSEPQEDSASASYLRSTLLSDARGDGIPAKLRKYVPESAFRTLSEYAETSRLLSFGDFSELIAYRLLSERESGYHGYFDVFEDLSEKIRNRLEEYTEIEDFLNLLKSKDIAYSHLSRALLHILLGIKTDDVRFLCDEYDHCPWLRPLGFCRSASGLLHSIRENADRPMISKMADAGSVLEERTSGLLRKDAAASELYAHISNKKSGIPSEYRHSLILI